MLMGLIGYLVAGLWAEVWRFGLGFGLMALFFAGSYFSPIFKRQLMWSGVAMAFLMVGYLTGVIVGERRVRMQWTAAELYTAEQSDKAHADAVRTVHRKPRFRLRDNGDPYNRDRH